MTTPRTIAINGRYLSQPVTGVQRFAIELVRALDHEIAEERIEIENTRIVLAAPPGATLPALRAIQAISVGNLTGHLWEQLDFPRLFRGALKVNLCGAAPVFGSNQIVTFHDAAVFSAPDAYSTAFRMWYRALFRRQGRLARTVITVSEFSRGELAARCGIPLGKIEVVSPSAQHILEVTPDDTILGRFRLRDRGFALCVGSVQENKNLGVVEEAGRHLKAAPFDMVVVGGRGQSAFRNSTIGSGWTKFLGRVSDAELSALYHHAFCFVAPSRYEGFGIPAVEAMHCGCPILGARAAAIPETCGDAALYFNPTRAGDLAARLQYLYGNPAEQHRLRQLGYGRAADYNWRASAHRFWNVVGAGSCAGASGAAKSQEQAWVR